MHKLWLIGGDGRIAVPHGSLPVSHCRSPQVLGQSKPKCHSSSCVLAPAHGRRSRITPNPTAATWRICSWLRTLECSCKSVPWALWELKKQNQSYKLLTVSFLPLWTDTYSVTTAPTAAFEEIIPYLRIITVLRVLLFPLPKSSSCHFRHDPLVGHYHAWACYHCFLSPWASQWFLGFAKLGTHSPSHPHLSWSKMPQQQPWQMSLAAIVTNSFKSFSISNVCLISKTSLSETLSSWFYLNQLSISKYLLWDVSIS